MTTDNTTVSGGATPLVATLISGQEFNKIIRPLAPTSLSFVSNSIPADKISAATLVSTPESEVKIYLYESNLGEYTVAPEVTSAVIMANEDCSGMFNYCLSLTSLDLSNFNTSNVIDMSNMFDNCLSLTSLDLSNFNTSNVTNMYFMFNYCTSLTSLNLSSFNTSNVTNMNYMFCGCFSLTGKFKLNPQNLIQLTSYTGIFKDTAKNAIEPLKILSRRTETNDIVDQMIVTKGNGKVIRVELFTITTTTNGNGIITLNDVEYIGNETAQVTIVPNKGYEVDKIIIDGTVLSSTTLTSLPIENKNHTIDVTFKKIQYSITINTYNGTAQSDKPFYIFNETATVTFAPNVNCRFNYIILDGQRISVTTSPLSIPIDYKNHILDIYFEKPDKTITVTSNNKGRVETDKSFYFDDDIAKIKFIPNQHMFLDSIKIDRDITNLSNQIELPINGKNHIIEAYFKDETFAITTISDTNGSIILDKTEYIGNETAQIAIIPNKGYEIDEITIDGVISDSTTLEILPINYKNHTISVTFKKIHYNIILKVINGIAQLDKTFYTYEETAQITFTPDASCRVEYIMLDGQRINVSTSPLSVPIQYSNHTVDIYFEKLDKTITIISDGKGKAQADKDVYFNTDTAIITFTPNQYMVTDYAIVDTIRTEIINNKLELPINGVNHTVEAYFTDILFNVNITSNVGGTVSIDKTDYIGNETAIINITPDLNYELDVITVDGIAIPNSLTISIPVNYTNHIIDIKFKLKGYTVDISAINGSISTDKAIYHTNDVAIITFAPNNARCRFVHLLVDGVEIQTTSPYNLPIDDKNHIVKVVYRIPEYKVTIKSNDKGVAFADRDLYFEDETATITFTPNGEQLLDYFLLDGVEIKLKGTNQYQIPINTSNHNVEVFFNEYETYTAKYVYTINERNKVIVITDKDRYPANSTARICITPLDGWDINWNSNVINNNFYFDSNRILSIDIANENINIPSQDDIVIPMIVPSCYEGKQGELRRFDGFSPATFRYFEEKYKKIFIADRNALTNISWNDLNTQGLTEGKLATLNSSEKYIVRMPTSEEWDKYIANGYGLADNRDTTWKWSESYSWCQDDNNGNKVVRGYLSADNKENKLPSETAGFRPVFEVYNAPPVISGIDEDLGEFNLPFTKTYNIEDDFIVTDTIKVIVKIDEEIYDSCTFTTNLAYLLDMNNIWESLSLGKHTITIEVTDRPTRTIIRTITFTKINLSPIISGQDENLGNKNLPFIKKYAINDPENKPFDIIVKIDNQTVSTLKNRTNGEFTFDVTDMWDLLELKEHTIDIVVTDSVQNTIKRRWVFTKINLPPIIDGQDEDLGIFNMPITKSYNISDPETDLFTIEEIVDTTTIRKLDTQANGSFTVNLSNCWETLSLGKHEITIKVTDARGAVSCRKYTFVRFNNPPKAPIITNLINTQRVNLNNLFVEFLPFNDDENNKQYFTLEIADDVNFTTNNITIVDGLEFFDGKIWRPIDAYTNNYNGKKFRLNIEKSKLNSPIKYIRVSSNDRIQTHTSKYSEVIQLRITANIDLSLPARFFANQLSEVYINLAGVIDPRAELKVYLTNNYKDTTPVWEDVTQAVLDHTAYTFKNKEQINGCWIGTKIVINAKDALGEISIDSVILRPKYDEN